ncbi:hypothetical protein IKF33_01450 [Candidatus Saccharibacteria bacterium]|nr:hypothetical protein [Candidatus Saccharibacteria bacterium]
MPQKSQEPAKPAKRPFKQVFAKWCDEWLLALQGIKLAAREPRFIIASVIGFLLFGLLMNLLFTGFSTFKALFIASWAGKWQILSDAFLAIFGVGRSFSDWLLVFSISLLQGILIGLITLIIKKRKATDEMQNVGIVTGLAVLGSGCPACGTTLLAPIIGTLTSTGSYFLAGFLSWTLMALAIIVAIFTLKKLGLETYVIIIDEKYRNRRKNHAKSR